MKNKAGILQGSQSKSKMLTASILALLSLSALSGCGGGGGGGGGGGSTTPSYQVFSGTVTNTTGSSSAGFTVRFDANGPETTSSSNGTFTIDVPNSDITGTDVIDVLDNSGFVVGSTNISSDASGLSGISVNEGPPPTPPLIVVK